MNLIATVTLALPLAVEALEPGLMTRPPRPPAAPIAQFELRDDQTIVGDDDRAVPGRVPARVPVVGLEKWWRRNRSFPKEKRGVIPMTGSRRDGTIDDTVL